MVKCSNTILIVYGVFFAFVPETWAQDVSSGGNTDQPLPAICTDRPTKSNFACTVDPGHFQYEADILNVTASNVGGVTTDTWIAANPTLKYGLTPRIDVEANFSPFVSVHTHGRANDSSTETGVSDLYLRMKYQFANMNDGGLQATLLPYVKVPTAQLGIGNGAVEGGALVPVNYKLTDTITLTTVPEVDVLKNSSDDGRHIGTAQLINLGFSLPYNLTLYGELWGDWNFDPAGTVRQFSADAAIAYGLSQYLQLDMGLNVGLNKDTPNLQGYVGISQKF
jgi:hypothetical protein